MMTAILRICRRFAARLLGVVALIVLTLPAVAFAQSETIEYYGLDALGSVRTIFDPQGNVVARMDYGPFGENLRAAITFPTEQFGQLARDAESGQDYAQARNYSAGTGRFNRVDPVYAGLFEPQAWNRYTYVLNRPFIFVDRTGRVPCGPFRFCVETVEELRNGTDAGELFNVVDGNEESGGGQLPGLPAGPDPLPTTPGPRPTPEPRTGPSSGPPGTDNVAPKPGIWTRFVKNMQCAATASQTISLAELSGYGDSKIAQLIGGNDIAAIATMAFGPDRLAGGADLGGGRLTQMAARGGMHYKFMHERIPLRATPSGGYESIRYLDGSLARTALGTRILAGAAKLSTAKVAYDLVTFAGSAAFCAGF